MGKLGQLNCSSGAVGNIGRADCEFDPGHEIGGIFVPSGFNFDESETADEDSFRAALLAHSIEDDATERIFAVGRYEDWAATGEAAQDQTFGSGLKRRTREATMQDDMTLVEGVYYHAAVKRTLHNKQGRFDYLKVIDQGDGTYVTVGSRNQDVSLNSVLGGFDLNSLNVSNYIYPVSGTVGTFTIQRGFSNPIDVDTNFEVMQTSFNPLDVIEGLNTVNLRASSTGATNITVSGNIPGSGSLADKFGADAAVAGAWVATNEEPGDTHQGNTITISTVTLTGQNYVITIAATGVDPDNPGTGKRVGIRLVAPSLLAALTPPVLGIESDTAYTNLG